MPYLMHIAVDIPFRPKKRIAYFSYNGVRFKYIQNDGRNWSDVLVTLVASMHGPEVGYALAAAGELISALAWEFDVGMTVRHVGGPGKPASFRLRSARCQVRVFPELPFHGFVSGYSFSRIANIQTPEQRAALVLYREALSSNKPFLSLLFNWQILEVGRGDAVAFANRIGRKHPNDLGTALDDAKQLPTGLNRLGDHLQDSFRDAIAHVRRSPGKTTLKFDEEAEAGRIYRGNRVIRRLARLYVERELQLTSVRYLVRRNGKAFPTYEDRPTIEAGWYVGVR
jgi:hypothetical protein